MIRYENECVSCPSNMGCIGDACIYRYNPVYICDGCGEEVDEMFEHDGEQLCLDCLLDAIGAKKVGA